jgi:GNAT superfamily N-acetyltransferase
MEAFVVPADDIRVPAASAPATGASPLRYPQDLERDLVSLDGAAYHLRPIRPDDASRLADFHRQLSSYSVYLRFFGPHPALSDKELEHFTCVDYEDRLALVAEVDGRLIAVGRYDRVPESTEAEVAFVVAGAFQHRGIGTALLDELAKAAWARGITTFVAETLAENSPMLGVFLASGFPVSTSRDHGTVMLRFPIEPTPSYRAVLSEREASRRARTPTPTTAHSDGSQHPEEC